MALSIFYVSNVCFVKPSFFLAHQVNNESHNDGLEVSTLTLYPSKFSKSSENASSWRRREIIKRTLRFFIEQLTHSCIYFNASCTYNLLLNL